MKLDISRSHVGPHFFAHRFREFCRRGAQERDIFREIAVTPCIQQAFCWDEISSGQFVLAARDQQDICNFFRTISHEPSIETLKSG